MTEDVQPLSHQHLKEIVRVVRETIRAEMRAHRQSQQQAPQVEATVSPDILEAVRVMTQTPKE